jgi:hypothetical protein
MPAERILTRDEWLIIADWLKHGREFERESQRDEPGAQSHALDELLRVLAVCLKGHEPEINAEVDRIKRRNAGRVHPN